QVVRPRRSELVRGNNSGYSSPVTKYFSGQPGRSSPFYSQLLESVYTSDKLLSKVTKCFVLRSTVQARLISKLHGTGFAQAHGGRDWHCLDARLLSGRKTVQQLTIC